MLVSGENHSGWPEALRLTNPTADKVLDFLNKNVAQHGIPKRNRTDQGQRS